MSSREGSRDVAEVVRPVRLKLLVTATEETTTPIVHCPRQDLTINAQACAGCMRMHSLEWEPGRGGEVHCLLSNQAAAPGHPRPTELREVAAGVRAGDVAGPVFTCFTRDVPLSRLRELFTMTSQRAIAVVDDDGCLEALVSRSDMVSAPEVGTVADVMTKRVRALPEDAPLPYAVSLLGHEDLAEVPLVDGDGRVTGIVHALDLVRWLAARLGYTSVR